MKTISVKNLFYLMTSGAKTIDLRSILIKNRCRGMNRAPQIFSSKSIIFSYYSYSYYSLTIISYHTFRDNSDCLRKKRYFLKIWPDDPGWPHYWPDVKIAFVKVWDPVALAVYLMPFTTGQGRRNRREGQLPPSHGAGGCKHIILPPPPHPQNF